MQNSLEIIISNFLISFLLIYAQLLAVWIQRHHKAKKFLSGVKLSRLFHYFTLSFSFLESPIHSLFTTGCFVCLFFPPQKIILNRSLHKSDEIQSVFLFVFITYLLWLSANYSSKFPSGYLINLSNYLYKSHRICKFIFLLFCIGSHGQLMEFWCRDEAPLTLIH